MLLRLPAGLSLTGVRLSVGLLSQRALRRVFVKNNNNTMSPCGLYKRSGGRMLCVILRIETRDSPDYREHQVREQAQHDCLFSICVRVVL